MDLKNIVPWGRSYEEYCVMFALSEADLEKAILGCADGPASFNAVLTKRGGKIISIDPIYAFSCDEIGQRIRETYATVVEQARLNAHQFVWDTITSPEELGRIRMDAMKIFLDDYDLGQSVGRYVYQTLPDLSFENNFFELALCSDFLFLYSTQLSQQFHYRAVKELCRVADEVRIFPLIDLDGCRSVHLDPVCESLIQDGFSVSIEQVSYEFQKGASQMLRITK